MRSEAERPERHDISIAHRAINVDGRKFQREFPAILGSPFLNRRRGTR
jgi:hypothetical protein